MSDIRQWLSEHGLSQLADLFEREQIDLQAAPTLSEADIKELGLPLGVRSKLRAAIQALQNAQASSGAETANSPSARQAERRQLTILFCDLVDSTQLSQRMDAEPLRDLMQIYQQTCRQVIEKFEGHVAQYLGDGLMVYFGWPRAYEDNAERAVRAALELVSAVTQISIPDRSQSAPMRYLQVRIGIATGAVVVGETGDGDASVPKLAVGETPNLAARLQGLAAANQIILGASTQRLLGNVFSLTNLGPHTLKGIVEPVQAYAATGVAEREGRFAAARALTSLTPLIGREDELALILRRWEQVRGGEGHAVLLCGEPGIGKSRITQAVRERMRTQSHATLYFQCSPYHVNAALHPFIDQFERAAGFAREDSAESKLDKMEHALTGVGVDLATGAPLMALLLSLPIVRYTAPVLTPQKQKEKTLACLADQIIGVTTQQPTLMLFEDAHWADPTSKELLDILVRRVEQSSLMLMMTYRPDFTPAWVGRSQVALLTLARLSKKEADALVMRITQGRRLPPQVLEHIVAKTDGIPLFVEEMTKAVLESPVLKAVGDEYVLEGRLSLLTIPSTLQDILMARLDRLAAGKEVAQIGACIGREFSHELIEAVAGLPHSRLTAALAELIKAELLFEHGTAPNTVYIFKHALIKDAAYGSLLVSRRAALHARIADVLEERFPEVKSTDPAILAQHFVLAGRHESALPYWESAAQSASQRFASAEAIRYFEQALESVATLPASDDRRAREFGILGDIGNIRLMSEGFGAPGQQETFERMRFLSNQLMGVERLSLPRSVLWWFHECCANYRACDEFVAHIESGTEKDKEHETARQMSAFLCHVGTDFFKGEFHETFANGLNARQLFSSSARPAHVPEATWVLWGLQAPDFLSWSLLLQGYPVRAEEERQKAMAMATEQGVPYSLVSMLTHWLLECPWLRTPERAEPLAREVIAQSEEHGLLFRKSEGQMLLGWALVELGDTEGGLAMLREGYDLFKAIGFRIATSLWLSLFAYAYQFAGRFAAARKAVDEALHFCAETGENFLLAELRRLQGDMRLSTNTSDAAGAERDYLAAIEIARGQEAKLFELRATCSLARLWQSQHKQRDALALLHPVYDWFTEGFDTRDLQEAKALLLQLTQFDLEPPR